MQAPLRHRGCETRGEKRAPKDEQEQRRSAGALTSSPTTPELAELFSAAAA
jgi:hypothetical protein